MPFAIKKIFLQEKQKAFMLLIKEFGYTQKEAQRFISKGRLSVNGKTVTKSSQDIDGEVEFIYFNPVSRGLKPIYEHNEFVVYSKPSGVLVHPQNRHTQYSLIDEVKATYGRDANIAHRIDQETSGLVLCAKNKKSEIDIKMMFETRDMKKTYLALVHGRVENDFIIDEPILRAEDENSTIRMMVRVHKDGKPSKTEIKVLEYFADYDMTLLKCLPYTGRQHQIRLHLFHVKHPIVGDPIYGQDEKNILAFLDKELSQTDRIKNTKSHRLLLHASELEFELYNQKFHIKDTAEFEKECLNYVVCE